MQGKLWNRLLTILFNSWNRKWWGSSWSDLSNLYHMLRNLNTFFTIKSNINYVEKGNSRKRQVHHMYWHNEGFFLRTWRFFKNEENAYWCDFLLLFSVIFKANDEESTICLKIIPFICVPAYVCALSWNRILEIFINHFHSRMMIFFSFLTTISSLMTSPAPRLLSSKVYI